MRRVGTPLSGNRRQPPAVGWRRRGDPRWGLPASMQSACQLLELVDCYEIESCKRTCIERQMPIWPKAMQDGVHRCCAVHQGGAEVWCARWVGAGTLCGISMWPQGPRTGLQRLRPVIRRCVTGLGQERPVAADESRLSTSAMTGGQWAGEAGRLDVRVDQPVRPHACFDRSGMLARATF